MKNKHNMLGVFLGICTGTGLLAALLVRTFLPRMILPRLNASALVVLCLAALLLDHYICKGSRRDYRVIPIYGALVFGLLPFAASFTAPAAALWLALMGAVAFTVVTWLFDAMLDRLSTGPAAKAAPAVSAFGLFLAAQCLMGIL